MVSTQRRGNEHYLLAFAVAFGLTSCNGPDVRGPSANALGALIKEPEATGSPKRLRLVTSEQYANTLTYIFGPDVAADANFPPVQRVDGLLGVGASTAGVTDRQLEIYQKTAAAVAGQVVSPSNRDFLIPCKPTSPEASDAACAAQFLAHTGQLLYRRPLSEGRLSALVDQAGKAADQLKDFYAGLGSVLEGMLVSSKVLVVGEISELDPSNPGQSRLDAYSLASRLSYFLWNASPDAALLKAAASGQLQSKKGLTDAVNMMLGSPRLEAGMRAFFDDMFNFDRFNNLAKDPSVYPAFTGQTAVDAREQTLRTVIDELIINKKDYRDLFTSRATFISPALAPLFQLPAGPGWRRHEFSVDDPRAGLMTQVSFLALNSHPARSSPTERGKALREILLCQKVPPPPANVDFSLLEDPKSSYKTARDRLTAHRSNPVCAGCHKITDPIGLALENFDGSGQYRITEKGALIDASGTLDGNNFKDAAGLGQALHDHPALTSCFVRRLYSYATANSIGAVDQPTLDYLNARFAQGDHQVIPLLRAIALSRGFSKVREGSSETSHPPLPSTH